MSISFNPTQTIIISKLPDAQRASSSFNAMDNSSFFDLQQAYCYENAVNLNKFTRLIMKSYTDEEIESANESILTQVRNAIVTAAVRLRVFEDAFSQYSEGLVRLSEVRKAHRALIDSLAPFMS